MTLFKLKYASYVLIEDGLNNNVLPLVSELVNTSKNNESLNILCYEHPALVWKHFFSEKSVHCFKGLELEERFNPSSDKCIYIIDSVNQMILDIGWENCLKYLKKLQSNSAVTKLIVILHRDCLTNSKLQIHLNHLVDVIVSYDALNSNKIMVQVKKGGKLFKSEEIISYNANNSTLGLTPVVREQKKVDELDKVLPNNLSTFKIETDQIQQLERNKLKLPYMSKINEGQGKVYYEPDAIDDWDDEDPDDDLDI